MPAASSFGNRARGLLGKRPGELGPGLWIPGCRSVHTFGMKSRLDLVFVDRGRRVVCVRAGVPPYRVVWGGLRAYGVLELRPGRVDELGLRVGDRVEWDVI